MTLCAVDDDELDCDEADDDEDELNPSELDELEKLAAVDELELLPLLLDVSLAAVELLELD